MRIDLESCQRVSSSKSMKHTAQLSDLGLDRDKAVPCLDVPRSANTARKKLLAARRIFYTLSCCRNAIAQDINMRRFMDGRTQKFKERRIVVREICGVCAQRDLKCRDALKIRYVQESIIMIDSSGGPACSDDRFVRAPTVIVSTSIFDA